MATEPPTSLYGACPFVSPTIKSDAAYSQGDLSTTALTEPVPAVAEASLNGNARHMRQKSFHHGYVTMTMAAEAVGASTDR